MQDYNSAIEFIKSSPPKTYTKIEYEEMLMLLKGNKMGECISDSKKSITILEFLTMVGNDFDWLRDWPSLIIAMNYRNGTKYTGFTRGGKQYDLVGTDNGHVEKYLESNLIEWSECFKIHVYMGSVKW